MGFRDIACHVWAIDGYVDDRRAQVVNDKYCAVSNNLLTSGSPMIGNLDKLVAYLVEHCRRVPSVSGKECTIYGGFYNRTDAAPAHMWIEYGNHIYDTMPGAPLRRLPLTNASRLKPPSEGVAFGGDMVGKCKSTLTLSQLKILSNAVWTGVEYDPPSSLD